jgi:hypothetical protein
MAEEIPNPERNVPLAMFATVMSERYRGLDQWSPL